MKTPTNKLFRVLILATAIWLSMAAYGKGKAAGEDSRCETRCRYDANGNWVCETICQDY